MPLTIGLYGLYLLLVAINGNGKPFATALQDDAPGFLPWLIAAGVLGALYEYDKTRRFATLFLVLIAISYLLKNFTSLQQQFVPLYNAALSATGAPASNATATALPPALAATQGTSLQLGAEGLVPAATSDALVSALGGLT